MKLWRAKTHSYFIKRQTCWLDGIEPTKDLLRLRFRACNRQPFTQQAVSPVLQQLVPTSDSPVVPPPTPAETVSVTNFSVGATQSQLKVQCKSLVVVDRSAHCRS